MINLIKLVLKLLLDDLDSGNSNISEEELLEILGLIEKINRKEYNKTEAANYLGVSTGTINNYVNKRLLPEGVKRQGQSLKVWYKSDLDKIKKK